MSIITRKTSSSILKNYSPIDREKLKNAAINKVRFQLPKEQGIKAAIELVITCGNSTQYDNIISFMKEGKISDNDLLRIISETRSCIQLLNSTFSVLVETLLSIDWLSRNDIIVKEFAEFYVDLLVAHPSYANFGVSTLISFWNINENNSLLWSDGRPTPEVKEKFSIINKILTRILNVIPMTFDVVLECIENMFPYHKKPSYTIAAYLHNVLWLLEYNPSMSSHIITIVMKKILLIDVNAPRNEIMQAEKEAEDISLDLIFEIDNYKDEKSKMCHAVAETLDVCMDILYDFIDKIYTRNENLQNSSTRNIGNTTYFKIFLAVFDDIILSSHNTHHIQFVLFYFCSLKGFLVEQFLDNLWSKVIDPNLSAPIRQASTGYIASFLARAKFVSIGTLKRYLANLCSFAHQYIQRCDSVITNTSLKANIVFFSVCQAIFYLVAFRNRDLASDKRNLMFLQSLQLSGLVTCNLNPLRVCLPVVASTFASVTRSNQLAYCHTILERNARRKLATVYDNDTAIPEECLETFFPFDPYILKKSSKRITPIYLQYQLSEHEQERDHADCRKRTDSISRIDDVDDFIVDKKRKLSESARSHDKDMQFNYGLSPGFHH